MKMAFGLGGLLVTLGVIVFIMGGPGGTLDQSKAAIDAQKKVDPVVKQLTGKSADGTRAQDSATLVGQFANGRMSGLAVQDVVTGGAYQAHYGLQPYDLIVQIGPHDLRGQDEEMGRALMVDAVRFSQPIVVMRGSNRLTLPQVGAMPGGTPVPGGTPTPAGTQQKPPAGGDPVRRQLDSIPGIPTH